MKLLAIALFALVTLTGACGGGKKSATAPTNTGSAAPTDNKMTGDDNKPSDAPEGASGTEEEDPCAVPPQ